MESCGGYVMNIAGCDRVNGQLMVSRAIGDTMLKQVVIGVPEMRSMAITDAEDFLVMACDGLWDYVDEGEVAIMVYEMLKNNEGEFASDISTLAAQLPL